MKYMAIILWTLLLASVATAQQQPVTPEQILQNMIAQQAGQIAQIGAQLDRVTRENTKAQARIKELEAKKEEKK